MKSSLSSFGLWRSALVVALLVASLLAAWSLAPRDLLRGQAWRASSRYEGCTLAEHHCSGVPVDFFFHTNYEESPYILFELEAPVVARKLRVENRSDGNAQSRAVPLVALASEDGVRFRELARRTYWFQTWEAPLPSVRLRYLKLMVPRATFLHLERVELFGEPAS